MAVRERDVTIESKPEKSDSLAYKQIASDDSRALRLFFRAPGVSEGFGGILTLARMGKLSGDGISGKQVDCRVQPTKVPRRNPRKYFPDRSVGLSYAPRRIF
jgi:hypothetical protein